MQDLPSLAKLTLEVDDDPEGCHSPHDTRVLHMTEMDVPPFLPCPNRRCRGGGLNLGTLLTILAADGVREISDTYNCDGYETHGQGRRLPCGNAFKVHATFELPEMTCEPSPDEEGVG
jgi:hypothetical protein